ncbi:proteasome subunit alpha [Candidatus Bathyarchaeota archaeon]|nr:proteasome subunit alpha [Candidatus Bathyarchaeota archaeon]
MIPKEFGYERPFTLYTPDGRLIQVEYAAEAVRHGSPVVGIRGKDFSLMVTHTKDTDPLLDPVEKIHLIDENIGIAGAGYTGDISLLIDEARLEAQRHRVVFEDPIDVRTIVNHITQFMYQFTRYSGVRPLGAALIVVGSDRTGNHLYQIDPRGLMMSGKAMAIGMNCEEATNVLREGYKEDLDIKDSIKLAVEALSKAEESSSPVEVGIAKGSKFIKTGLEDGLRLV